MVDVPAKQKRSQIRITGPWAAWLSDQWEVRERVMFGSEDHQRMWVVRDIIYRTGPRTVTILLEEDPL